MAEEKVIISIEVGGQEKALKTIKEIKQARKELTEAALQGDEKAVHSLNELNEKFNEMGDRAKSVKGGGIEPLKNSLGLLTEGIETADFEKFKIGLKGIGEAMKAIPMLLLIEGLTELIKNFDEVINFGKELFDVFSDEERAVHALTEELEQQKETTEKLSKELTREISIMEAQGKSHTEILAKKKELIQAQIDEAIVSAKLNAAKIKEVMANDSISESIDRNTAALYRKLGLDEQAETLEKSLQLSKLQRNKENIKAFNDSLELIKDLQTKSQIEEIKDAKQTAADIKKINADKLKDYLDLEKQLSDAKIAGAQIDEDNQKMILKDIEDEKNAKIQAQVDASNAEYEILKDSLAKQDEARKKAEKDHEASENAKVQAVANSLNAAQSLSDTFFALQLNKAKGNAQAEIKIKKQMFEVDKAFNVSRAIIDGIRSVQAALTIPPPGGEILAVANGVLAAANVAKILATKFDPGSSSSGIGSVGSTSLGGSNIPSPNNTSIPNVQQSTRFDANGNKIDNRVYVLEQDITKTQRKVANVADQAKIG